jgi:DMSO/TMAO reductase YedYZ molybdopterin-dependent catalytic subunit
MSGRGTATALLLGLLLGAAPAALAQTREFSPTVAVEGQVTTPRTYTLADLQALPAATTAQTTAEGGEIQGRTYRGVRLYDLLQVPGRSSTALATTTSCAGTRW